MTCEDCHPSQWLQWKGCICWVWKESRRKSDKFEKHMVKSLTVLSPSWNWSLSVLPQALNSRTSSSTENSSVSYFTLENYMLCSNSVIQIFFAHDKECFFKQLAQVIHTQAVKHFLSLIFDSHIFLSIQHTLTLWLWIFQPFSSELVLCLFLVM